MSYLLNRVAYQITTDTALLGAFRTNREMLLESFGLEASQRVALVGMDVVALWRLGLHPLLLMQLASASGVSLAALVSAFGVEPG